MSALKQAVLHLLHIQLESDNPSTREIAKRHHGAVSSECESEPVLTTLECSETNPALLEKALRDLMRRGSVHELPELQIQTSRIPPQAILELPVGGTVSISPQSDTVAYADGSSASGPGRLPRVSPSGSPAVSRGAFPVESK